MSHALIFAYAWLITAYTACILECCDYLWQSFIRHPTMPTVLAHVLYAHTRIHTTTECLMPRKCMSNHVWRVNEAVISTAHTNTNTDGERGAESVTENRNTWLTLSLEVMARRSCYYSYETDESVRKWQKTRLATRIGLALKFTSPAALSAINSIKNRIHCKARTRVKLKAKISIRK